MSSGKNSKRNKTKSCKASYSNSNREYERAFQAQHAKATAFGGGSLLDPSPSEISNLLEISRPQRGGVVVDLFKNNETTLNVQTELTECPSTTAKHAPIEEEDYSPMGVWIDSNLVGRLLGKDQTDIDYLQSTGLITTIEFSVSKGVGNLKLSILDTE